MIPSSFATMLRHPLATKRCVVVFPEDDEEPVTELFELLSRYEALSPIGLGTYGRVCCARDSERVEFLNSLAYLRGKSGSAANSFRGNSSGTTTPHVRVITSGAGGGTTAAQLAAGANSSATLMVPSASEGAMAEVAGDPLSETGRSNTGHPPAAAAAAAPGTTDDSQSSMADSFSSACPTCTLATAGPSLLSDNTGPPITLPEELQEENIANLEPEEKKDLMDAFTLVAIKKLNRIFEDNQPRKWLCATREIQLMMQFRHDNIIAAEDFFIPLGQVEMMTYEYVNYAKHNFDSVYVVMKKMDYTLREVLDSSVIHRHEVPDDTYKDIFVDKMNNKHKYRLFDTEHQHSPLELTNTGHSCTTPEKNSKSPTSGEGAAGAGSGGGGSASNRSFETATAALEAEEKKEEEKAAAAAEAEAVAEGAEKKPAEEPKEEKEEGETAARDDLPLRCPLTQVLLHPLEKDYRKFLLYQIMRGVGYMHAWPVMHRDLKPENVLVNRSYQACIADFGQGRDVVFRTSRSVPHSCATGANNAAAGEEKKSNAADDNENEPHNDSGTLPSSESRTLENTYDFGMHVGTAAAAAQLNLSESPLTAKTNTTTTTTTDTTSHAHSHAASVPDSAHLAGGGGGGGTSGASFTTDGGSSPQSQQPNTAGSQAGFSVANSSNLTAANSSSAFTQNSFVNGALHGNANGFARSGFGRMTSEVVTDATQTLLDNTTQWYAAPETLSVVVALSTSLGFIDKNSFHGVDVWSIGCIAAEMLLGKPLFYTNNVGGGSQIIRIIQLLGCPTEEELDSIASHRDELSRELFLKVFEKVLDKYSLKGLTNKLREVLRSPYGDETPEEVELIIGCLAWDPAQRLTVQAALESPFFTDDGYEPVVDPDHTVRAGQLRTVRQEDLLTQDDGRAFLWRLFEERHPEVGELWRSLEMKHIEAEKRRALHQQQHEHHHFVDGQQQHASAEQEPSSSSPLGDGK